MKKLAFILVLLAGFTALTPFAHAETQQQCTARVSAAYTACKNASSGTPTQLQTCLSTQIQDTAACASLGSGTSTTSPSSTGTTTPVTLTNPLGTTDIRLLIARLISAVLSIIGVIALLMFVYGGFLWMLSAGNESQVEKGKEVLKWTTIGIILIVSAYVIVNALFRAAFTGAL